MQRAAADALGRHPDPENIRPLLDLRQQVPADDTHLLHVVRMALRDQLRAAAHWDRCRGELERPRCQSRGRRRPGRAHRRGGGLPDAAAREHDHGRREPVGVASSTSPATAAGGRDGRLLPFGQENLAGNLEAQAQTCSGRSSAGPRNAAASSTTLHEEWASDLTDATCLARRRTNEIQAGIEMAGRSAAEHRQAALAQPGRQATVLPRNSARPRLEALANIDLVRQCRGAGPGAHGCRNTHHPAGACRQSFWRDSTRPEPQAQLVQALPTAPARLQTVIAAGLAGNKPGAEKLLEAVAAGKASARLLQERAVEVRLNQTQLPDLKARIGKLTSGLPPADQRVQDLLRRRREGFLAAKTDTALGAKVFEKSCANCHQIANKGARIGPQLDGIGIRGIDRLLEDTLDPNRNVDQAFRTTILTLNNGQSLSGLLLKEEGEVLVLADQQGKEVRVPKKMVEERATSQLSPMPANLAEQISEPDFYHLLAYLLSQRVTGPGKPGEK